MATRSRCRGENMREERYFDEKFDEVEARKSSRKITTRRQIKKRLKKHSVLSKTEYTKNWTDYEKQVLLNLLYQHGDSNLELLAAGLPNKHVCQVKTYLRTISRRVFVVDKNRKRTKELLLLDSWLQFLKENYEMQPIEDAVPFELFSIYKECHDTYKRQSHGVVDFQKAYEYLFALSVGRKIDIDEQTFYFVHSYLDCFLKHFDKHLSSEGLAIFNSAIKKVKGINENINSTPNQVLHMLFQKMFAKEEFLRSENFIKTIFKKMRQHDCYVGELTILREKTPEEIKNILEMPSSIIPKNNEVYFKNMPSFVWACLFNVDTQDILQILKN